MPPADLTTVTSARVRPATLQDASAIAKVRVDSWRATYRGMIPDTYLDAMSLEDSVTLWERILSAPEGSNRSVFVAETQTGVIGFAAGMMLDEEKFGMNAELTGIYLQPQAQRAGVGRRMLRAVAEECAARGASGMLVWVISGNQGARKFYEKLGAEHLIEQPFTWDGLDLRETGYGWRNLPHLIETIPA
jgi:ribosomal protein S18 acetylase RimI-like enzyme